MSQAWAFFNINAWIFLKAWHDFRKTLFVEVFVVKKALIASLQWSVVQQGGLTGLPVWAFHVRPHQARCLGNSRSQLPVTVLLQIECTVLQCTKIPVMSTKTRMQPLDGIITTLVQLDMSILRVSWTLVWQYSHIWELAARIKEYLFKN